MLIGHKKQWAFLKNKFESNQLSHAYLFVGPEGVGKKMLVKEFAEFIECKFPDLMIVEAEDGKELSIAKIREVQNFLSYKSYNGGIKMVLVNDAHLMNQEAQSCFLKTLEEPKGQTLIIMVTSKPDMMMQTISSRCQTIKFFRPKDLPVNAEKSKKEKEILDALLPVIDASFAEKFKYTKALDFDKQNPIEILEVLQKYYRGKLLADYKQEKVIKIINLIENINNKLMFTNANPKLALEILLMEI